MKFARLVLLGRRAAVHRQKIGRKSEIALYRQAARHVLDVRVEPPVLMNDDHHGPLAAGFAAHEIAVDLALGRVVGDAFGNEPGIVGRHDGGACVVVL